MAKPSFNNPPINEVVCGSFFKSIENFLLVHYGQFWQEIKDQFPKVQHAATLGPSLPKELDQINFPLPRLWLISGDENTLVQVQNNCFFFNWRKLNSDAPYPRYEFVIKRFKELHSKFSNFVSLNDLDPVFPTDFELTYINHIMLKDDLSDKSLGDIFPDYVWRYTPNRFLNAPSGFSYQSLIEYPEESTKLIIKLQSALSKDKKDPIYVLTLTTQGVAKDNKLDSMLAWYEFAHDLIVNGFVDLTDENIRKNVWKQILK